MKITINGENREVDDGSTVADLLRELGRDGPGVAVALNLDVLPRERRAERPLSEGDRVDLVTAVGGG